MRIIDPRVSFIDIHNPFEKIEYIGRTCYKSEDKISEGSAEKFVQGLISRQHFAMLEHVRLTYEIFGIDSLPDELINLPMVGYTSKIARCKKVHYLTLSLSHLYKHASDITSIAEIYIDSVYQVLLDFCKLCFITKYVNHKSNRYVAEFEDGQKISVKILDDIYTDIYQFDEVDNDIHGYYSIKFVCDRGVSHELVRHRCAVAQESTRYCNYASDKFGEEVQFIAPTTFDSWPQAARTAFISQLLHAEATYLQMINEWKLTPQQARAVLPNCLKTEVILTMPVWQWKHFFNLRSIGTTGSPHPDMKTVADAAHELFKALECNAVCAESESC